MFEPASLGTADGNAAPDWIAALAGGGSFVADGRYNPAIAAKLPAQDENEGASQSEIAKAFEEGRSQGLADAADAAGRETAERRKLGSRLRRMDEDMIQQLGQQLSETIVTLCEATLAPLALDRDLLGERCAKAARLLGESSSNLVLRLNPKDIEILDEEFRSSWTISPDTDLSQGSLRIEGPDGGISDGPAEWRAALTETLGLERSGC